MNGGCGIFLWNEDACVLKEVAGWVEGGAEKMDETTIDREAMGQLANALAFICGENHPTVAAMKKAVASGTERDTKNARTQFLKLKASDRRAALAMLKD
jgi:hypothetical protein